jgi:putative tryptophan/tyrosine transport system substrate-binding protein
VITRRAFVGLALAAAVLPRDAVAQTPAKQPRIAYVGTKQGFESNGRAFIEGLRVAGRVPGQNCVLDVRNQSDGLTAASVEAIAAGADVILAGNPVAIEFFTKATKSVPIVGIDLESDPVARGWVASLAKPGGNFTGFFLDAPEISGKQLQFLKEIRPQLTRVAVLGDERVNEPQFRAIEAAARTTGLALDPFGIKTADEVPRAFDDMMRLRAGAVVVLTSPLVFGAVSAISDQARKHRLASICPFSPRYAEAGGLLAYGPDLPELFHRAGGYVDRILKGANVGELPIQRPEKFLLVVNLKTARALKLTLPTGLVQRSDRVIE